MPTLQMSAVSKTFGSVVAVDNVSFEVDKGQIVSLLGPSGCGKTTILRLIAGFEQPDQGRIFIAGQDTGGRRPYERNVGLLFQDYALFPHMSVEQNVAFGMRHRGVPRDQIPGRSRRLMELMKLIGFEHRYPGQLSGGQRQRTALARALATEPDLLLLDEPLSALDAKLREELRVELKELLRSVGSASIIVTHDQDEAMSLSDHILVMNQGRIVQNGSAHDIYHKPANRFVAGFIGQSNWFSGQLGEPAGRGVHRFCTAGDLTLLVATPRSPVAAQCEVCIRPERVTLVRTANHQPGMPQGAFVNVVPGTIKDVTDLGASLRLQVMTASGHRISVYVGALSEKRPSIGETVKLVFQPEDCIVIPDDGDTGGVV